MEGAVIPTRVPAAQPIEMSVRLRVARRSWLHNFRQIRRVASGSDLPAHVFEHPLRAILRSVQQALLLGRIEPQA